jgi:uridine phosphorylase
MTPILENKHHGAPSVFSAHGLLREARRQKRMPHGDVPAICLLDPDGDLFRGLRDTGARRNRHWACYHTDMHDLTTEAGTVGVVGCAVGAPFAVLVAEQLFASGCQLLVSVTSAGQIAPVATPPYFVLIDRALRDEGTSYHYLPPSRYARVSETALDVARRAFADQPDVLLGGAWTTDAPFRETEAALAAARAEGLLAVEMEAAALYAFAQASGHPIICLAHVTNQMARVENDFEKGESSGNVAVVGLATRIARAWGNRQ